MRHRKNFKRPTWLYKMISTWIDGHLFVNISELRPKLKVKRVKTPTNWLTYRLMDLWTDGSKTLYCMVNKRHCKHMWNIQIDPHTMPLTRLSLSYISYHAPFKYLHTTHHCFKCAEILALYINSLEGRKAVQKIKQDCHTIQGHVFLLLFMTSLH